MPEKVAHIMKVKFEIFQKSMIDIFGDKYTNKEIREIYDNIQIPKRSTSKAMGYDIHSPINFTLDEKHSVLFPTGLCVSMDDGWGWHIFPRSGLGFKYTTALANTVGLIDGDYIDSDNGGHIMMRLILHEPHTVTINAGDRIAQGVFIPYGITCNDDAETRLRNGGLGSTGK